MKRFSDFNIEISKFGFVGDKIEISKVINKEIIIINFKIDKSKFSKNKSGNFMTLQIEMDSKKYIIFTGSDYLMNQISKVKDEDFPFITIIEKENKHFNFK